MYTVKKQSKWKVDGSVNTALSIAFATAGNGTFSLKDPNDLDVDFPYEFAGGGLSWGPNLNGQKGKDAIDSDIIGIVVPIDWPNGGDIWISTSFEKDELTPDDFKGFCLIVEFSLGLPLASMSAMEMWFGIPLHMTPKELSLLIIQSATNPLIAQLLSRQIKLLRTSAKGRLRLAGINAGLSLSVGGTLSLGSIGKGEYKQAQIIKMPPQSKYPKTQMAKDSTVITISGDVLFDWDKDFIKPAGYGELAHALNKIRTYPNRRIRIIGYTDNTEKTPGHNQKLSERRAKAVSNFFMATGMNLPIETEGRGAAEPVSTNSTKEGREKNRRVEIYIMPN